MREPSVVQDVAPEGRDRDLLALFAELGPEGLEPLDGIWDLCSKDLYGLALWRTGAQQDAEDVMQDVFIRLVQAAERGGLAAVEKPFAYLLRMTHSAAVDVLRQRKRHRGSELDEVPEFVEASLERAAEGKRLSRHLKGLPEGQRSVVYLKHFAELSFREIGEVMKVPTFTAASRYRLALRRLRHIMGVEL